MKLESVKVKLKFGDVELELTPDELLELRNEINKLLPEQTRWWPYPVYPHEPIWTWTTTGTSDKATSGYLEVGSTKQ